MTNNNKKQLPPFLVLTIIAVIAAIVLAGTNMVTRGPILEHAMKALRESFSAVMPADVYEEITVPEGHDVKSLYAAKDASGNLLGYCVTSVKSGYAGDVAVTLGVDGEGVVTGCVVGDNNFVETSGFGSRARDAAFQDQFKGISAIEGGSFDALSGATVTSTAVLNATNNALKCVAEVALGKTMNAEVVFGAPKAAESKPAKPALTGAVQSGEAQGFQSKVKVNITLDANGAVSGIEILSGDETPGFGTRCGEEAAFAEQFIGKTGPFAIGEGIDALSGATVTSKAVVEAVNVALTAPASAREAMVGTAKGFQSDVTVTITMDGDKIASVTVDSANETPGFGTRCAEDVAFLAQFVGKTLPVDAFDVLSGATVTSKAVVEAMNAATPAAPAEETVEEKAAPAGTPVELTGKGFQSDVKITAYVDGGVITGVVIDSANETPGFGTRCAEDEAFLAQFVGKALPLTETVDVLSGATVTSNAIIDALKNAVVEAAPAAPTGTPVELTGKGFQSDVKITAYVDENNVITAIEINSANETPGFGTRCGEDEAFKAQFIGKALPLTETVDVLSGATITSNVIISGLKEVVLETPAAATESAEEAAPAGALLCVTGKGFQSDVMVNVTLDENNTILAIEVLSGNETPGFGTRCAEDEAFLAQFIGKALPLTEAVDVLSGATVTSNAIIDALKAVVLAAPEASATDMEETPAEEVAEVVVAEDNANEGKAQGFQSEVTVKVTVDENMAITGIEINSSNETPNFGTRCAEDEAFLAQFIGKTLPLESIDVLSGATVTSNAVMNAINAAVTVETAATDELLVKEETPAAELTGKAQGFQSEVTVKVTLDAAGAIAAIVVESGNETPNFGTRCAENEAFLAQFIGKTLPLESIDVLSGATVTSNAVLAALNAAK